MSEQQNLFKAEARAPGPWRYEDGDILDANGMFVAALTGRIKRDENGKINTAYFDDDGRLMAAAPDLLASLERLCSMQGQPVHGDLLLALIEANALIDCLKGES